MPNNLTLRTGKRFFVTSLLLFFLILDVIPQKQPVADPSVLSKNPVPYGLSQRQWERVQKIWSRKNYPVIIDMNDSSSGCGQLIAVKDTFLLFWEDPDSFFNLSETEKHLKSVEIKTVRNISPDYERSKRFVTNGTFIGTAIGAAIGTGYVMAGSGWIHPLFALAPSAAGALIGGLLQIDKKARVSRLSKAKADETLLSYYGNKNYIFADNSPEGFFGMISGDNTPSYVSFDDILSLSSSAYRIFHSRNLSFAPYVGISNPVYLEYSVAVLGFSTRYNFHRNLSAGYSFRYFESSGEFDRYTHLSAQVLDNEWYKKNSHTFFLGYSPVSADRVLTGRFEISTGIGVSMNIVDLQLSKYYESIEPNSFDLIYDNCFHNNKFGFMCMAGAGFFVSNGFSININAEKSFIGKMDLKEITVRNPRDGTSMTFNHDDIDWSAFDILFGFSFHF